MWYAAHVLMRYHFVETRAKSLVGYENILIIDASSPEEAIARATELSKDDEVRTDGHWLNEQPVHLLFEGVKKGVECQFRPGSRGCSSMAPRSLITISPRSPTRISWLIFVATARPSRLLDGSGVLYLRRYGSALVRPPFAPILTTRHAFASGGPNGPMGEETLQTAADHVSWDCGTHLLGCILDVVGGSPEEQRLGIAKHHATLSTKNNGHDLARAFGLSAWKISILPHENRVHLKGVELRLVDTGTNVESVISRAFFNPTEVQHIQVFLMPIPPGTSVLNSEEIDVVFKVEAGRSRQRIHNPFLGQSSRRAPTAD